MQGPVTKSLSRPTCVEKRRHCQDLVHHGSKFINLANLSMFHGAFAFRTTASSADKNHDSCLLAMCTCSVRNHRVRSLQHSETCDKCHLLLISNKDSIFRNLVPAVNSDKRLPSASVSDLQVPRTAPSLLFAVQ